MTLHRIVVPLGADPHPAQRHLDRATMLGAIDCELDLELLAHRYTWNDDRGWGGLHEYTLDSLLTHRIDTSTLVDANTARTRALLPTH